MEALRGVKYNYKVVVSPEKFNYMLSNVGILSDIVLIRISPSNVCFMEHSLNSSSRIDWSSDIIPIISKKKQKEENKIKIAYNFLRKFKPLTSLIKERDKLILYISDDEPFKIKLILKNLGASIEYYIAHWIDEDIQ